MSRITRYPDYPVPDSRITGCALRLRVLFGVMTSFAKRVYQVVLSIPLGQVRTYKWVAQKVGKPKAYRAVGQALKDNPYPLIIPCHRVVRGDRNLGGYIFGRKNKKLILSLEKEIQTCLQSKK